MICNRNKEPGCQKYQALIQRRLDGAITAEENLELDGHLADCSDCLEELTSLAAVQDLLNESRNEPAQVPQGFFESLSSRLDEVTPARGWQILLAHPLFTAHRNVALAMTSLILVVALTWSVGAGALNRVEKNAADRMAPTDSKALILTNRGDTIVLYGDEGEPDQYSEAIDDLEEAYREAQGQQANEDSEVYIHTSWHGGESASP